MRRPLSVMLGVSVIAFVLANNPVNGAVVSGPQTGEGIPSFDVLIVSNPEKPDLIGKRDLVGDYYGQDPFVLIFVRDLTEPFASLAKRLDAEVGKNKAKKLHVLIIMLHPDQEGAEKAIGNFVKQHEIKHITWGITENVGGPESFKTKLSRDAEVTVILSERKKGKTNHAFEKGKLTEQGIDKIVADVPTVLPK